MELLKRIEVKKDVLAGKPVIKGTRISVELILQSLVQGMTCQEICENYQIKEEDICAAILYAEQIMEGETVLL